MRRVIFTMVLGLLAVAGPVQAADDAGLPFDPRQVVEQARVRGLERPRERAGSLGLDEGEFLIDTNVTHVGAPDNQYNPALAFDGTNFLVVWEDGRSGSCDVYGARVTPAGVVLDPSGIAISTAANDQNEPALAFDGANFLVVWTDYRGGPRDIYGARVTPAGVVLDTSGIAISTAGNDQESPALAFDGANFLVVWQDTRGEVEYDIYGTRVTPAGVVLDTSGIAISSAANNHYVPALAFDGTDFLVVWQNESSGSIDIYGARVTPAGVVLDTAAIAISTAAGAQWSPALAFDGSDFLVVWKDSRRGWSIYDVYGARVTPAGAVLDPTGIAISRPASCLESPALAFDGTNFLVVWEDKRSGSYYDVYGARVTPAGVVLDPSGIAVSTAANDQWCSGLAFDGTNFLAVWQDSRSGESGYDVYGARVTPAAAVLDPSGIAISTAASNQCYPALAFDGTNFLVVWQESRSGESGYDIYGARVTPAGVVLDTSSIAISTTANDQWYPALAFDGTNFLVVWQESDSGSSDDIYGARVTPAGVVLDTSGIAISTAANSQSDPALAFDGTSFLVVWTDGRSGSYCDIYGARVTPAGVVLEPSGVAISTAADYQWYPALAFDGTNFLVVWQDSRSGWDVLYGARVTPAGVVLDPSGIAITYAMTYKRYPAALAFDGANFLVVWQDSRSGSSYDIYGARVTPAGVVLDLAGIAISTAASDQCYPALAFDGTNFLVVWADKRGGSYDIYGARVTPGGVALDSGPVVMQEGNQSYPALARGDRGQVFLVYSGWAGTVGGRTYNAGRIWGMYDPLTGIVETMDDERGTMNIGPTIVRGCLVLPQSPIANPQSRVGLLDVSGRKVADLHPGPNDVRHLTPGVYFVAVQADAGRRSVAGGRKVVVAR